MDERKQELIDYGMAKSVARDKKYKGEFKSFKDWEDYYDKGNNDIRLFYKQLDAFLLSNINRPYEKVYGEFCAKWPARIGKYTDTRKAIRRICGIDDIRYADTNDFCVTDKGILKKNFNGWRFKKKPKKTATIGYSCENEEHWAFNKDWFKYPEAVDYINSTIGEKNANILMNSEYIPRKIAELLHKRWRVTWRSDDNFFWVNKHWRDCGGWVYKRVIVSCPITVTKGTDEYSRFISEKRQSEKIAIKNLKKEIETKASTLLHDIEQKKKDKENQKDIIDRDRFGFDEESFKGEFYHGQKRKKK